MIAGLWSRDTIAWVIAASLLPCVALLLLEQRAAAAVHIALAIAVMTAWQLVFRVTSGVPMSPIAAVSAVAIAVLAPGDLALWQLALAVSFGTVLGELIFGGWGRNFLSGPVVSLAFLYIAFPDIRHESAGTWIALACAPAAVVLLATGILSWMVLASAAAALFATAALLGAEIGSATAFGGIAFGFVYLVGDPVSSPSSRTARALYGALSGALTAFLGQRYGAMGAPQAIVFATLLASIFAPLIDQAVIAGWLYRRRSRYG